MAKPKMMFLQIPVSPAEARSVAAVLGNAMDCAMCSDGSRRQFDAMAKVRDALNDAADEGGAK